MAFTCGFFNSENGDRKYNAEQMSAIFDGIIADGVFTTIGDHMAVTAGTGMQVLVGTGKAWFDHTWNVNDAAYPLTIAASDVTLSRIDAIVLETNHSDSVRLNKLRVVQGTVASSPVKPSLTNSEKVHQHPLAWVTVAPGVTKIAASAIENAVGTSACPFVTGIIATTDIDDLFAQWNGEFDEWFDNLKAQLSDNVVANLQRQIDALKVATGSTITDSTASTLEIAERSTVDYALNNIGLSLLAISTNSAIVNVHVTFDGSPISGISFEGLKTLDGTADAVSDSNGDVYGVMSSDSTVLKPLDYGDIAPFSQNISLKNGKVYSFNVPLQKITNYRLFDQSTTIRFVGLAKTVEIIAIAGGGSGGTYYRASNSNQGHGGGGGGGEVVDERNFSYAVNKEYVIAIGAGGASVSRTYDNGNDGGKTTITDKSTGSTLISAAGGGGGKYGGGYSSGGASGAGSGVAVAYGAGGYGSSPSTGDKGSNGQNGKTVNTITGASVSASAGGGGGDWETIRKGGSPGGGNGGLEGTYATDATVFGSGGGGAGCHGNASDGWYTDRSGAGYRGAVYIACLY